MSKMMTCWVRLSTEFAHGLILKFGTWVYIIYPGAKLVWMIRWLSSSDMNEQLLTWIHRMCCLSFLHRPKYTWNSAAWTPCWPVNCLKYIWTRCRLDIMVSLNVLSTRETVPSVMLLWGGHRIPGDNTCHIVYAFVPTSFIHYSHIRARNTLYPKQLTCAGSPCFAPKHEWL